MFAALFGLLNDVTRRQPVIQTARENELEQMLEIELVRRHAQHDHGLAIRHFPHGSRMAHGAVETHLLHA